MSLGSIFPDAFKKKRITERLKPGIVIKHKAVMDDGKEHEKRYVVLSVSESTLTCVINTDLSNFIKSRAHLLNCQISVPGKNYEFLDHDSYIDCSRIRTYKTSEIISQLLAEPSWIYEKIDDPLRKKIIEAMEKSEAIDPIVLKKCCKELGSAELG
jgi:hypothetical protein